MSDTLSAESIIVNLSRQIELHWVAGEEDPKRPLHAIEPADHATLIGHLNLIHKNIIQVIGKTEHKYLQKISKEMQEGILDQLFCKSTIAVIVTDGIKVPQEYKNYANEKHVPLLSCKANSNEIVDTARYYLSDLFSEKTTIHGVFMEVFGAGVLITGASSVGKSELALELISRGHRLIADDAPEFTRKGPDILDGRSPDLIKDFIEVRGLGVLNVREMYGDNALKLNKYLRLIIHMERLTTKQREKLNRLEGSWKIKNILGVNIQQILLPVAPGRNLAVLVEAAVRNHILRVSGHNAAEQLMNSQQQAIDNK